MTLTNEEKAEFLDDAADLMEKNGWYNPRLGLTEMPGVCAMTSVGRLVDDAMVAKGERPHTSTRVIYEVTEEVARYLGPRLSGLGPGLSEWNDQQESVQPVLDAFRKVAKELRRLDDLSD